MLLVCCSGPWSVNMIDIGWNISQLTVVHNVGCGMGWCVTRCLPGSGATEPCLSVPIFLNIIPRRMRDGTQFSMTYNPQPSLHIRVYATYVWVKTRQHFFIIYKNISADVEDDLDFLVNVCHFVYKHHDKDIMIILQANHSLCKFKNR